VLICIGGLSPGERAVDRVVSIVSHGCVERIVYVDLTLGRDDPMSSGRYLKPPARAACRWWRALYRHCLSAAKASVARPIRHHRGYNRPRVECVELSQQYLHLSTLVDVPEIDGRRPLTRSAPGLFAPSPGARRSVEPRDVREWLCSGGMACRNRAHTADDRSPECFWRLPPAAVTNPVPTVPGGPCEHSVSRPIRIVSDRIDRGDGTAEMR
jgi:hypothetical protein